MKSAGFYIVGLVAILHIGWAVDMTLYPVILNATPIYPYHALFGGIKGTAAALYIISILALVADVFLRVGLLKVALLLPQQAMVMISAWSSYTAISTSQYSDHVIRNTHFIFRDQWCNIATMILHSGYMLALFASVIPNHKTQIK